MNVQSNRDIFIRQMDEVNPGKSISFRCSVIHLYWEMMRQVSEAFFLNVTVMFVIFAFEILTLESSALKYNGGEVNFIYQSIETVKKKNQKNISKT